MGKKVKVVEEPIEPKGPRPIKIGNNSFIKITGDSPKEDFRSLGEKIQAGTLKWSHYSVENDRATHYYLILKQ
jgi:hypothetical protein